MGRVGWDRGKENGVLVTAAISKKQREYFHNNALKREQNVPVKSGNWVTVLSR